MTRRKELATLNPLPTPTPYTFSTYSERHSREGETDIVIAIHFTFDTFQLSPTFWLGPHR